MTNLTPATLSSRGRRNLTQIYARIRGAVRQREDMARDPHTRLIDLSTAENWLVRDELLDIMHDGVRQHMQAPQLSYPAGLAGDLDVLDALAAFVNDPRRSHFRPRTPVTSAHVATAPGASACLDAVLFNVCDEGDAVLLPAPYWSAFELLFRTRAHVTPLAVKTTRLGGCFGTEMLAALDAAVDASWTPVKALVLTNPHNPLGRCYPRWWLEACVRFCGRRGIHFVSDEIYAHSLFGCGVGSRRSVVDGAEEEGGDEGFVSALSLDLDALGVDKSLVHVVWSMSKDFGASGIRLGCTISQWNRPLITGHALASFTATSNLSAVATTALLTHERLPQIVELNAKRLANAYAILEIFLQRRDIPYIRATAGCYVFAKLAKHARSWEDEGDLVKLLQDEDVLVASGRGYANPDTEAGWMRLSFAVEEAKLQEGIRRIDRVLDRTDERQNTFLDDGESTEDLLDTAFLDT